MCRFDARKEVFTVRVVKTGCPDKLWMLPPQKYLRLSWMGLWPTWSGEKHLCFCQGSWNEMRFEVSSNTITLFYDPIPCCLYMKIHIPINPHNYFYNTFSCDTNISFESRKTFLINLFQNFRYIHSNFIHSKPHLHWSFIPFASSLTHRDNFIVNRPILFSTINKKMYLRKITKNTWKKTLGRRAAYI